MSGRSENYDIGQAITWALFTIAGFSAGVLVGFYILGGDA